MQTVGIIGGMGPGATLDLFQKIIGLTQAERDQDHLHLLIDNYPQIPDRTAYILGAGESPIPYLLQAAKRLEAAGAELLCMPCNTAHYFVEEIRRQIAIPFLSIIEICVRRIVRDYPKHRAIGLLATRGTIVSGIYHQALAQAGLEVVSLGSEGEGRLMEAIYAVKAGRPKDRLAEFHRCVEQLQAAGAELLIAGCTEIPLLLPYVSLSLPVVDPTQALAEEIVEISTADSVELRLALPHPLSSVPL